MSARGGKKKGAKKKTPSWKCAWCSAASAAAATANAKAATAAGDCEDAQDTLGYQVRFTDALQTKIDELAALAKANGVDAAAVDAIKNGPNV